MVPMFVLPFAEILAVHDAANYRGATGRGNSRQRPAKDSSSPGQGRPLAVLPGVGRGG
jgi:hypothetical protein